MARRTCRTHYRDLHCSLRALSHKSKLPQGTKQNTRRLIHHLYGCKSNQSSLRCTKHPLLKAPEKVAAFSTITYLARRLRKPANYGMSIPSPTHSIIVVSHDHSFAPGISPCEEDNHLLGLHTMKARKKLIKFNNPHEAATVASQRHCNRRAQTSVRSTRKVSGNCQADISCNGTALTFKNFTMVKNAGWPCTSPFLLVGSSRQPPSDARKDTSKELHPHVSM